MLNAELVTLEFTKALLHPFGTEMNDTPEAPKDHLGCMDTSLFEEESMFYLSEIGSTVNWIGN